MSENNKTILITGVTRGLGAAMTEEFIELGHTIWGCGRSVARIEKLQKKWDSHHDFVALDVSHPQSVEQWAEKLLAKGQIPDLIINNAGIINRNNMLWEVPADEFSRVIDINIKGVANIIRYFVPGMVEQNHGIIVNFSSGWGRSVSSQVAPYCATKWAIEGLTLALAQELPSNMAAIPLNPGIINTQMLQIAFDSDASLYLSPQQWAKKATLTLLKFTPDDNGRSMTV